MPDDQIDPSDRVWREALAPLGRADTPPADLEERVRVSLRSRGHGTEGARKRWSWIAVAATLLIALAALLVRFRPPVPGSSESGGPQYLLLLYEGSSFSTGSVPHDELVREYSAWAGQLAKAGKLVEASELESDEQLASGRGESTRSAAGAITGFFIVRAMDAKEAAAIAAGCPHLRYGGEVAIRALRVT